VDILMAAPKRHLRLAALLAGTMLPVAGLALGQTAPRILSVTADRQEDFLLCRLVIDGVPTEKATLSMQSGLVSSLELILELLDEKQHVCAGNRITFQLAFDLWEEVFAVRQAGQERRFADLEGLTAFLSRLPALPVAPVSALDPDGDFQVRVGLILHPIAPSERERVEDVIVGEIDPGAAAGEEGREVSIGLGRLIRFFYQGSGDGQQPQVVALSSRFRLEDLGDEPD
jgi:hypothetical protein